MRGAQKARNSDLAMLLQFLHLYSLFASSQDSGFAPPVLPPVVERATGQELSAVMTLFNALANGRPSPHPLELRRERSLT